jgi:hypothetical protein
VDCGESRLYNWYGLMGKGHRVHLANTVATQQYEALKYTDDDSDALSSNTTLRFICPLSQVSV